MLSEELNAYLFSKRLITCINHLFLRLIFIFLHYTVVDGLKLLNNYLSFISV